MKIKVLAGVILLSAGFVPGLHSENIRIKVVKEEPSVALEYAVDTGTNDPKWQSLKNNAQIKYDDNKTIKKLYVKRPSESVGSAKVLFLLDEAEQKRQGHDIIVVNEIGFPRYWKQEYFKTSQESKGKSRSRL